LHNHEVKQNLLLGENMHLKIICTTTIIALFFICTPAVYAQDYISRDEIRQMKEEMQEMKVLIGGLEDIIKNQNKKITEIQERKTEDKHERLAEVSETDKSKNKNKDEDIDLHDVLSSIKPKISVTGDFVANLSDDSHIRTENKRFNLRGVDLSITDDIDGVGKGVVNFAYHDDDVMLEEAYLIANKLLPYDTNLKLGKFRVDYGLLNTVHPHNLPQVDYPAIYREYLGHEGYIDEGIGIAGQFPSLWETQFKYSLQVLNGNRHDHDDDADLDHKEEDKYDRLKDYDDLVYVGRLENAFSPINELDVNWGLSGLTGKFEDDSSSPRFYYGGSDLTLIWQPFEDKYKRIRWQSEVIIAQIEDDSGWEQSYGLYSFVDYQFLPKWLIGARYDYVQLPFDPDEHRSEYSGYLTYLYSKNNQIRIQLKNSRGNYEKDTNEVFLQWIFTLGRHDHDE
jgi:hypothetical protein